MIEQEPPRRYRIVELVGEGGFGRVYRARLEADRFVKDVAVKLLRDARPDAAVITRFRDEAHVLGLIRDRAVVAVDPPTQLDGQTSEGRVTVYLGTPLGPADERALLFESDVPETRLGQSVAVVPDIDGDGCPEIALGTGAYEEDLPRQGLALLYTWAGRGQPCLAEPDVPYSGIACGCAGVPGRGLPWGVLALGLALVRARRPRTP